MKNKSNIFIAILIAIMFVLLGYIFISKSKQGEQNESSPELIANTNIGIQDNNLPNANIVAINSPTEASWFISNQNGWVLNTLAWQSYPAGNVSFSYPPNYTAKIEKIERRAGLFEDQITIIDPNGMTNSNDKIYFSIPYTGGADPRSIYEIKENVNNTGADFAISLQASDFAKYIFNNIVASAHNK